MHMKKTFAIFVFNMLLYFTDILAKTVKCREKNARIKKIQGIICVVFSPCSDMFREVFTMAETWSSNM